MCRINAPLPTYEIGGGGLDSSLYPEVITRKEKEIKEGGYF
jgi:hypothetical protein